MAQPTAITAKELETLLKGPNPPRLIDVREPAEWTGELGHIEGAELIPLQQLNQHADKLQKNRDRKIVVHCKSGGRSMQFTQALRQAGFKDVKSMAGGILLWNKDVNPGGPQY